MTQTTFAGASPWAGLTVSNVSKTAEEKPMEPRKKPAQTSARAPTSVRKTLKHTNIPLGESRHNAVLTEAAALDIFQSIQRWRKLKAEMGKVSPAAMAAKYGISDKSIRGIEIGRSWSHVTGAKPTKRKRAKP